MPWREWSPMEERIRFVFEYGNGVESMSEICRSYGISRKTGYKWLKRYQEKGLEGLAERPRCPGSIPHKTPREVEELILALRGKEPGTGPKKLAQRLYTLKGAKPPAPSTIGDILKRNGLIKPRRRRKPAVHRWPGTLKGSKGPNELWSADFKGWFRTKDRSKCHALTVSDHYSRYAICVQVVERPDYRSVSQVFTGLFQEVGLPERIRVDNGTPFGCPDRGHLSRLAVDWLKVGVSVEYIKPGHPEQNGRHERLHRTLKEDTADPPARDLPSQQKRFELWLKRYNHIRPHEALGQVPPGHVWREPERRLVGPIPDFDYPSHWETRRVRARGDIMWEGQMVPIGRSFYGTTLGLRPTPEGWFIVYAGPYCLGVLNSRACEGLIRPSQASLGREKV